MFLTWSSRFANGYAHFLSNESRSSTLRPVGRHHGRKGADMLDSVLLWIDKNQKRWLGDLKSWLAIPSVSAQPEHKADVRAAAEWALYALKTIGLEAKLIETPGHPCVLATTPQALAEPGAPHILLYGHFDVQPAEPLDLWTSPPFGAATVDGKIVARGACDDKGQVHAHLAALLAWREINQKLPCRVTVLLEGEEEVGSTNFMGVVRANAELLKTAETVIISDSAQFAPGVPAITYGLRGLVYFELTLTAANSDLHSGVYGGAVPNAAQILIDVLAKLHDGDNRITVPGFYDAVQDVTEIEKKQWATLPASDETLAKELGLSGPGALRGEKGYSSMARRWARPTLEINGLTSGYQGAGAKTVLPAIASAKFSCRLVPDQTPADIAKKVRAYVESLIPAGITVKLVEHGAGSPPAITPMHSRAAQAAAAAVEIGFGKAPVFVRDGGSIPVVTWLKDSLGLDTVMVGFGLPTDNIHAPNEKLDLENYFGGIKTAAALYDELGKMRK
jgi:acetylornithine deacetylase/succinyl-diaminopimelate desuccinylase-like protein